MVDLKIPKMGGRTKKRLSVTIIVGLIVAILFVGVTEELASSQVITLRYADNSAIPEGAEDWVYTATFHNAFDKDGEKVVVTMVPQLHNGEVDVFGKWTAKFYDIDLEDKGDWIVVSVGGLGGSVYMEYGDEKNIYYSDFTVTLTFDSGKRW